MSSDPSRSTTDLIWDTDDIPMRARPPDIVWARRAAEVDEPISLAQPQTTFDDPVETSRTEDRQGAQRPFQAADLGRGTPRNGRRRGCDGPIR